MLIAVGLFARGASSPRRRRRVLLIPATGLVVLAGLAISACGGDSEQPGTPAGSYELAITGTANGRTHTLSLSLTVR